jgi:ornithine cyclodeaminase
VVEGAFDPAALQGTLTTLCRGTAPRRHGNGDITLFKSVGTALEDLAAAEQVWVTTDNAALP